MRILMLNHEYPPVGGGGGLVTYNIARQLVLMGHKITVLTTGFHDMLAEEVSEGIRVLRIPGVRNNALDNNATATGLRYLWEGTKLGKRLVLEEKPDVIHADFTIPAGIVAVRLARTFEIPVTVTLHGADVPGHNTDEFGLRIRMLKPIVRGVWNRSSRVIAVSQGLKRLARMTIPRLDIQVVNNGVNAEHFAPPSRPRSHEGPLRLVCITRLVQRKGIQYLLQALACIERERVFDYSLTIVGDGNFRSVLEGNASRLGLSGVKFIGAKSHAVLPDYYRAAEVYVLPSLTEAFGLTFCEAMACGTPVLGTTVGGIPEVVRNGVDGYLIPPANSDAIYKALIKFGQNRDKLDAMGAAARKRIAGTLTWRAAAEGYLDNYLAAMALGSKCCR